MANSSMAFLNNRREPKTVRARIQINVRRSIREGSQGLLVSDQVTTDDDAIDVHSNR